MPHKRHSHVACSVQGGVSEQVAASKVDSGTRGTTGESFEEPANQIPQEPTPPVEYIFDFLPERRKAEVLASQSKEGGSGNK